MSLKEVAGLTGEPVARLTPLWWTCVGPLSRKSDVGQLNYAHIYHSETKTSGEFSVEDQMKTLWNIDVDTPTTSFQCTPEEQLALDQARASIVMKDGRYEIGIPWRNGCPPLPNNRSMAERRFFTLERSLMKKPEITSHNRSS
jgi:hypothetical protein